MGGLEGHQIGLPRSISGLFRSRQDFNRSLLRLVGASYFEEEEPHNCKREIQVLDEYSQVWDKGTYEYEARN